MDPERDGWVALPGPTPGFFVRYDYFWSCDVAARDQGKDRPTCLIAASDSPMRQRYIVLLPITHSPPRFRPDRHRKPGHGQAGDLA